MNSQHPWLEWLYIIVVLAIGIGIVVAIVKLLLHWAHKDEKK